MYSSHIDIPAHIRKASMALLQTRLSDALDLEAQMKQAHWNVKGPAFFQLHQLFDQIHSEVEEIADTIAERITAIGGVADGRVQTTAKNTMLYEYSLEAVSGEEHLKAVAAALAEFGKAVRTDIAAADDAGDADTADVFTEISRTVDKKLWFVEAHLATD